MTKEEEERDRRRDEDIMKGELLCVKENRKKGRRIKLVFIQVINVK